METYIKKNLENTKQLMNNINKERYKQLKVNRYKPIIEMIEPFIDVNKPLLDIGIREGAFLDVLKEYGFKKLYGTDIYKDGVESGNKKGHTCFISNAMKLDLDMKFNTITISHVIEHCPDINKVLDNIYNHLEENGILYVEVPKEKKNTDEENIKHGHYFNFTNLKELESFFINDKWNILDKGHNTSGKRLKIVVRKK